MPSLQMKIKSTTGCLKEKNGLHVCRKSSMISKNTLSQARVVQNAEESESCTNSSLDVSVCDKVYAQYLGTNKPIHDGLSNDTKQLPIQQPTLTNSATVDNCPRESTSSVSMPNIMNFHNSEGNDEFYVPQLDSNESDDVSRKSCEYPPCNLSNFYISDMIYSGSNSFFNDDMDAFFLPDYTWDSSSLLCRLTEEDMVLPFLEDTPDSGCDHKDRLSEETIANADMAIQQLRSYNPDSDVNAYLDLDYECFDYESKLNTKRITLVLDLDETLVHSTMECCDGVDFTFTIWFDMKEQTVYVKRRPHLETFLKRVAEMFEIVVFTASQSIYAKPLLDILDPDGKIISQRAYRESCMVSEGTYTKDLTVLGVDLAKVAIIDNSPQVFRLQVNNGIPIKSWFNDPSDCELISLLPFLETLVDADDVRPIIARKFGNKE